MYTERYILRYIEERKVSMNKVKEDTGIDLERLKEKEMELTAGEFFELCVYLSLSPEDVLNWVLLQL
ncbi:MAG: hypothetical protein K2L07_16080 [Lachnospiraceae bacterium]|nr:hypothetical protein [Lachnospiraceae bacterium]